MNKFIIFFLLALVFNSLYANEYIFISPKVSLKMIDKKEITFLALNDSPLKIKKSKIVNMKTLESSDILGRTGCSSFYLCASTLEKYFSSLGIEPNEVLEKLFNKLKLNKDEQHYIYCMSGAQKAFYVMMALRELGYSKVKAFAGDWNTWEGDINE